MTLKNYAYLIVSDNAGDAVFELNVELERTSELEKNYTMGDRGQYIREFVNQTPFTGNINDEKDRRAGFYIDGGAGSWSHTLTFETGMEDVRWGDGSGGTGPSNITQRDASGADVTGISRANIFDLWMARSTTDSRNPGWLYFGEWTEADQNLTISTPDGAMGEAMPVAITNHSVETSVDAPGVCIGSVTMQRLTPFSDYNTPDWLGDGTINSIVSGITDSLEGFGYE